jgi:2',3'-cyclic-nucleotide 2'-phosphodiesterase (5'-nucleotidase family)
MSKFVHFGWKFCLIFALIAGNGCRTYYAPNDRSAGLSVLDSTIVADSAALIMIAPYKSAIDIEMNEILVYSEIAITKNQPEGLLNNFVSDLILYMCNTYYNDGDFPYDVAVFNNGGLRAALPRGVVTVEDVYKLMPFENEIVILTLSSEDFYEMVKYIVNSGGVPFSGMQIITKQMQIETLTINGEPFTDTKNYTVITSDYLASGGDKMNFFQNPLEKKGTSVLMRDMIIDYLREQNKKDQTLHPKLDGRIVYE